MIKIKFFIIFCCFFCIKIHAQNEFILTKEGKSILHKRTLVNNCLWSLKKDRSDYTALSICDCQINKLDGYFTMKQYKRYTKNNTIDINSLVNSDSVIRKSIEACYVNSGKATLLHAESFGNEFISVCIKNIQKNTEKKLDTNKVRNFCNCQLNLIKAKKITDVEIQALNDPNSVFFFEVMHKCGNPFDGNNSQNNNWNDNLGNDINGPPSDTIKMLSINGMSYVKLKTGSLVQVWLFDTGASDLLINNDIEKMLKTENIIGSSNYLGVSEYEMANGIVDTCRRYSINNVQIGKFTINNIIIAVTDKGKRIIVGKSLLNKFSSWVFDNKNDKLILNK